MKLYIAADHAGLELKTQLIPVLIEEFGCEVIDCGATTHDPVDDYPPFMKCAAEGISQDSEAKAILLGGSGQGEAIVANRYKGVRTTVYYGGPLDIVRLGREHNDANVLSLGARFMNFQEAKTAVSLWLLTPFSGDVRHKRRIALID